MEILAIVTSSGAVVAIVILAVLYGKYRAAAKAASSWEALARAKDVYATKLKEQLAAKETVLRAAEKARLANMPADAIVDLFRGMYGPRGPAGK